MEARSRKGKGEGRMCQVPGITGSATASGHDGVDGKADQQKIMSILLFDVSHCSQNASLVIIVP